MALILTASNLNHHHVIHVNIIFLGDPIDFLSWFINSLHIALNGTKKPDSSIIYKSFLGSMRIYTRKIPPTELDDKQKGALLLTDEYQEKITESPFLYLTCDLPPPPLFKDEFMENIIPQVNSKNLWSKWISLEEISYMFSYKQNKKKLLLTNPNIFYRLICTPC